MGARYIVTDLDLRACFDLSPLAAALGGAGLWVQRMPRLERGIWSASFQPDSLRRQPARDIGRLLKVIEGLDPESRLMWDRCIDRRFDMGFEGCGDHFYSRWKVDLRLLSRIQDVNGSIVITVYRNSDDVKKDQDQELVQRG